MLLISDACQSVHSAHDSLEWFSCVTLLNKWSLSSISEQATHPSVNLLTGYFAGSIGSEGWFGASTPGLQTLNPPTTSKYPVDWNATEGSDFVLNNILPAVDFATLRVRFYHPTSFYWDLMRPVVLFRLM
jgi:hypothetical protein